MSQFLRASYSSTDVNNIGAECWEPQQPYENYCHSAVSFSAQYSSSATQWI